MNIMWIPLLSGSHSAAPASSDGRPIRPLNLPHSPSAISTPLARTVPRRQVASGGAAVWTGRMSAAERSALASSWPVAP